MKTALLIIDPQKVYTDEESELYCPDASATIARINSIAQHFEATGDPVFLVRHVHKADGSDLGRMFDYLGEPEEDFGFKEGTTPVEFDDSLYRPSRAIELRKTRYSAFVATDLDKQLKSLGVQAVVICGFMANCCCDATARDAHALDYYVTFVVDATGSPGTDNYGESEIRKIEADFMEAAFARVVTADELTQR